MGSDADTRHVKDIAMGYPFARSVFGTFCWALEAGIVGWPLTV